MNCSVSRCGLYEKKTSHINVFEPKARILIYSQSLVLMLWGKIPIDLPQVLI